MNRNTMRELAELYLKDPQFAEQMRQDPVAAAEGTGLELDDEDRQSLKNSDWSQMEVVAVGDEELRERVSKRPGTAGSGTAPVINIALN